MSIKSTTPKTRSKFLELKCKDCDNVQVVFNKAATTVHCQICGTTLVIPTGGKSKIKASITGVLE